MILNIFVDAETLHMTRILVEHSIVAFENVLIGISLYEIRLGQLGIGNMSIKQNNHD